MHRDCQEHGNREYLRPILVENEGWALFIYTPRGRNHGHAIDLRAKPELVLREGDGRGYRAGHAGTDRLGSAAPA